MAKKKKGYNLILFLFTGFLVSLISYSIFASAEETERLAARSEFAQKRLKPSISEKAEEKKEYLIGSGDVLDISVWKIADLSREVIVRPDGMISYPLIGDLQAEGRTLTQLDEELTRRLSIYVKEPQVSVMIKKFGGKKVIVLGEVASPGVHTFTGDIRLMEALALAGDCTRYAVKKNVLVIRGDIHRNPQVIVSNTVAILKKARLSENVLIQPQDIVYVPRSLIGNINAFLEAITPSVDAVYKGSVTKTVITEW